MGMGITVMCFVAKVASIQIHTKYVFVNSPYVQTQGSAFDPDCHHGYTLHIVLHTPGQRIMCRSFSPLFISRGKVFLVLVILFLIMFTGQNIGKLCSFIQIAFQPIVNCLYLNFWLSLEYNIWCFLFGTSYNLGGLLAVKSNFFNWCVRAHTCGKDQSSMANRGTAWRCEGTVTPMFPF